MKRNQIFTILAVVVLFALVGVGLYFASQSANNQAPDDAQAACNPGSTTCSGGRRCECIANLTGLGQHDYRCRTDSACNGTNPNPTNPNPTNPNPTNPNPTNPPPSGTGPCWGATCTASQVCVGGCIKGCRANTKTANGWIDAECGGTTCTGEGAVPSAGKACCAGMTQCGNGRCGVSCGCTGSGGTPGSGQSCCSGLNYCGGKCQTQSCGSTTTPPGSGNGGSVGGNTPPGGSGCTSDAGCSSNQYCVTGTPRFCANRKALGATCAANNECGSNFCGSDKKCQAVNGGGASSGSTTAGSGSGPTTVGASCEPNGTCGGGLVCQGVNGSRQCQQPTDCADGICNCSNGGTCTGYITFTCTQLTNGQCLENPVDGQGSPACGQVDKVWIGGPCNRKLCGDFTIYNNCSGGGTTVTNPPPPTTTTNPPPPATPYCGDAVCATNELCERTSPNATTYRACGGTGSAPNGAVVNSCYGIGFSQPVQTTTCKYCGDGVYTPGNEQCDASAPASGGNNPTQCNASCLLENVANACISLTENGVDPIRSGASNFVEYTLIYQHNSTSNPYPNIRLLVSTANTTATAVGRDANSPSSALVAPIPTTGYSYDSVTSRHTYRFRWESVNVGGGAVPDATYQVRGLTDGTNAGLITTPSLCTETLTASAVAVEEPLFNIIKSAGVACVDNSDATINYTVTVTNSGPVSGVVDFVTDDVDPAFVTLGITPTNIVPAYGSYSAGTITWTGTIGERTFTAGQSRTYTYTVVIPVNQLLNFSAGVQNLATVQYDTNTTTDNTDSFNLRTMLNCTINGIPITGIFDDGRLFLFGLIFIILGFVAYRYQFGKTLSEKLITGALSTAEVGVEKLMPFEERIERKMDRKMKDEE